MFTYLEELTVTEAEQVRKTIQALFRQTCILQVKYDPATLTPRDNPQYEICARHRVLSKIILRCSAASWSMMRRNIFSVWQESICPARI